MIGKKFLLTLFSAILLPTTSWGAEVWDAGSFEASPGNTDSIAAGAGKIRDTRGETRERVDVEHIWGDKGDITDDNGLHRMGSGRCFMQDTAPTVLSDSIKDYDNTGGTGVANLADGSTNSSGAAANDDVGAGRCWIDTNDNNKMYVFVGVAGDSNGAWVEVQANRVKAGGGRNILENGDFEANATDATACDSTSDPTGWTGIDAETIAYEADATLATGLQGSGCQVIVTDVDGGDGLSQELAGLKANTTYRVTAQVLEGGADICTLSTADAATQVTGMVSVDNTAYVQLEGFFITAATALDTVTLSLTNTAAGDVCYWDHIAVYREENAEVPESSIVPIYDTYVTSPGADVEEQATGYEDVPDLSIAFTPPTENWIFDVKANISIGCEGDCGLGDGEGVICHIEKGGTEIAGTVRAHLTETNRDWSTNITMDTIEINPAAGTAIVYTVACKEVGTSDIIYNFETDNSEDTESSLSMIAFPPH